MPDHMLQIIRRLGAVLIVAVAGCSNGGGSTQSVSATKVSQTGAIVADPARNRIYVADAGNRRLAVFHSVTGAFEAAAPLAAPPDGVASDARGERLFVSLPTLHRIIVLDATTFAEIKEYVSANALHALAWRDGGRLVVASDAGLLLIDVDAATEVTIDAATTGNALIVQDHQQRRVWAAFSRSDQLVVATIDPDLGGDLPVEGVVAPSVDPPTSLTLAYDGNSLLIGSRVDASIYVVDAASLAVNQVVARPPALVALAGNVTSTRLYVSPGDASAIDVPADTFVDGADYLASAPILPLGAVVDTIGSNLVVHTSDAEIESVALFDDTLFGEPILITGKSYTLTLTGSPNQHYFLIGASRPGFIHYGPASAQPQHFVDVELATVLVLAQGKLDGAGQATFTGTVNPASVPDGTQFFLQAVLVDPATKSLGEPTNPMRITIFDATNP